MQHLVVAPPAPTAPDTIVLEYAISRLPDDQRTVLCLFYFERLSLEQIAAVLEQTEDEVAELFYWANVNVGACPAIVEAACAA